MLSQQDALNIVKGYYTDPETKTWIHVGLEFYERAQATLQFPYPRNPRTVDGEGNVTKVPQVCACLARVADSNALAGHVTYSHHGPLDNDPLTILWSYHSDQVT